MSQDSGGIAAATVNENRIGGWAQGRMFPTTVNFVSSDNIRQDILIGYGVTGGLSF